MSNIKNAIKTTEDSGTTIAKDSLIAAVKKSADKSFPFAKAFAQPMFSTIMIFVIVFEVFISFIF